MDCFLSPPKPIEDLKMCKKNPKMILLIPNHLVKEEIAKQTRLRSSCPKLSRRRPAKCLALQRNQARVVKPQEKGVEDPKHLKNRRRLLTRNPVKKTMILTLRRPSSVRFGVEDYTPNQPLLKKKVQMILQKTNSTGVDHPCNQQGIS